MAWYLVKPRDNSTFTVDNRCVHLVIVRGVYLSDFARYFTSSFPELQTEFPYHSHSTDASLPVMSPSS